MVQVTQNGKPQPPAAPPEASQNATDVNRPSSAGAKVTVACKLPHGLRLRLFASGTERELVMGGGSREVTVFRPLPGIIILNGVRHQPFGQQTAARVVGGYALTEGVDKDFWDKWLSQNKDSEMVRERLVFAYENADKAVGQAKEQAELRHGMEPLAKDGDPRARRSGNPNLDNVTEEEDRKKAAGKAA